MRRLALAICVAAIVGCGGSDFAPATALFDVEGDDFYALPYPNDIRVGADGRIDLSKHQRPNDLTGIYIDAISENQRGFSNNAPIFFRFDAILNPESLPETPADSIEDDASVYLVNIEPGSSRYGERVPATFRFEAEEGEVIGENWLSVAPFPGFPLEGAATYAAVVTKRVDNAVASADFELIRDGAPTGALAAAQAIYQPLWDYLDEDGGDDRSDVVSAAVFTTQDPTGLLGKIREVIYRDVPAPSPRDLAPSMMLAQDFTLYEGVYDGPVFQRGTVPYNFPEDGGDIEIDANGDPVVQGSEELRFALSVPKTPMPASGWPIVLYAHGTGGSYISFFDNFTAANLAREGLAVISIDQVLHGPRNPGGNEELNFFNFQNPLAARDNTLQGALDDFQLARLVADFDEVVGAETIRFDTERVYFFGHSQGGLTGVPFVAFEPMVKGAVFSGSGGNIILSLLNKTRPVDIAGLIQLLIRDNPLDEFNPMLGLIQGYVDRSDPVNFAPLIFREPPAGREPVNVFHGLGVTDNFTPVPSIKALATSLGVAPLAPLIEDIDGLGLRGLETVTAPVSGNIGSVTGVVAQYNQAPGADGHFVLFDVQSARTQSTQFLGSLAREGVATVVAP